MLTINPFINQKSTLAEVEAELEFLLTQAEGLDWSISRMEEQHLKMLTTLAKAKGSKKRW